MNSLAELQRRKAELKAQIEQQQSDLKKTFFEIRKEIEPANLLKKAVSGTFNAFKNKQSETQGGILGRLPAPIAFLADLLIKDPKWALALKVLAPVALEYLPKFRKSKEQVSKEEPQKAPELPAKAKVYGRLRRGIATLRSHLRKTDKEPKKELEKTTEQDENYVIE